MCLNPKLNVCYGNNDHEEGTVLPWSTSATLIAAQAFWRGTSVRLSSGRRKADMRVRLRQAALKAAHSPTRQLGFQTNAALHRLAAAKQLPQALPAMATLSMCSQYSKGCCKIIAGRQAPTSLSVCRFLLLLFMRLGCATSGQVRGMSSWLAVYVVLDTHMQ